MHLADIGGFNTIRYDMLQGKEINGSWMPWLIWWFLFFRNVMFNISLSNLTEN